MRHPLKACLLSAALVLAGCTGASQFATCRVESTPPSAEVWLGEEQRDSTPCDLLLRETGEFEVHVKKPGYTTVLKRVTVVERREGDATRLVALPDTMTVTLDPLEGSTPAAAGAPASPTSKPYYE